MPMTVESRILDLHHAFKARRLSPVALAESQLAAIAAQQASVNAFCQLAAETTLRLAEEADRRYRDGSPLGLLDGVPVSLKDSVNLAGWPTRKGSRSTSDEPAARDAVSVRRLREAGAVFLGKTTTPEFAWKGTTDSPLCGVTRNPLDLSRTAGGSSGGAAAAIALGIGAVAVGTDAAGSVRIPSAFCGTVGYKPSFGRIPLDPFPVGFFQLPHIGPITATVADAAISAAVMAGPAASDWTSLRHGPLAVAPDDLETLPAGLRIGLMAPANIPELAPAVARTWGEFRAAIEGEFQAVSELELAFAEARDIAGLLYRIGCADAVRAVPQERRDQLDPGLLEFIAPVRDLTAERLIAIMRLREQLASRAGVALLEEADVILTPTMGVLPLSLADLREPHRNAGWLDWNLFTPLFNLAHGPAISVPWPSLAGLPIGIQVAAAPGRDLVALQVARRIERLSAYRPASLGMPG